MSEASLDEAMARGMSIAFQAARVPDRTALISPRGNRTFAQLNARANQLARTIRDAGVERGDVVAVLSPNRPEYAEIFFATQRVGARITPVNWHLSPEEAAYVVADSEAKVLFADAGLEPSALAAAAAPDLRRRIALGDGLAGFEAFDAAADAESSSDIDGPALGDTMLYTSGTTGRPKGVRRAMPEPTKSVEGWKLLAAVFDFRPDGDDTSLATGPLYHSGPIHLCLNIPISSGIPTVLMDKWSPAEMLRLIQEHRVTHTYCVPTMFGRLLGLGDEERLSYDVSSLRFIIHGAAPCPVETKKAIIDWVGPIVTELYAATEGMGTLVTSQEWLERPGTVGRPAPEAVRILADDGSEMPAGEVGTVFICPTAGADFEYKGAPEKTASALRDGYFTVGDLGYLDDDGYLFLTGRSAELIISGGTNVYPAEIDQTLIEHPKVRDAAAYGVPDPDWGEVVHAAIALAEGATPGNETEQELLAFYADALPSIKRPRALRFVDQIPRSEAGKILRRRLREERLA